MNKTRKFICGFTWILTSGILCLLAFQSIQAGEPSYKGKALSEWLVANQSWEWVDASAKALAPDAIRQIGTNAIPILLQILDAAGPEKRKVASKLKSQELKQVSSFRGDQESSARADEEFREVAVDGFEVLGTNAEPAIPQLTKLLYDPASVCRMEAATVLAGVGPKGFAVLTNAFKDEELVGFVTFALAHSSAADQKVVTQLLIRALQSPSPIMRGNAADWLAGKDATLVVPALIPMLDDTNYYAWHFAANTLGQYGSAAKSAAPKLLSLYTNHPNVFVLGALRSIDRAAAGKAEAFLVNSGPLNAARSGYTRTLLKNGKELIVGGVIHTEIPTTTNRCLSAAELLDPVAGKWTETGQMNFARSYHTATMLNNSKVLVAGGSDCGGHDISSAELYDPATGKWTETGSMNSSHYGNYALLQPDGKVLVFSGGWDGVKIFNDKRNQELYDPATEKWTVITKQ